MALVLVGNSVGRVLDSARFVGMGGRKPIWRE